MFSEETQIIEQVELNTRSILQASSELTYSQLANFKSLATIWLQRNLIDDTFNLSFEKMGTNDTGFHPWVELEPFVVVNSKKFFPMLDDFNKPIKSLTNLNRFMLHRSMIENPSLRKLDMIGLGYDVITPSNDWPFIRYFLSPKFEPINLTINLDSNETIHLKAIKEIKLSLSSNLRNLLPSAVKNFEPYSLLTKADLTYCDIWLKPRPLERWKSNEILYEVHIQNENRDLSPRYDIDVQPGQLKSSAIGRDVLHTNFEKKTDNSSTLVGLIKIEDYTYYDYDKGKIEVGYNFDSEKGEIIPYNAEGIYNRSLKLSLNSVFDNLNLNTRFNLGDPILDSSNGIVNLEVYESSEHLKQLLTLPKEYFESKKDSKPTLKSLVRISKDA